VWIDKCLQNASVQPSLLIPQQMLHQSGDTEVLSIDFSIERVAREHNIALNRVDLK
jgi:hypothetical protein